MNTPDRLRNNNNNYINLANRKNSKEKEFITNPRSRERLISRLQEQAQKNISYLKKSY